MTGKEMSVNRGKSASFPVVLGQACREKGKFSGEASRYRARFQASSGHSDSANRPGYEAEGSL